jgi:DNA-binding NtrC family response regulator
MLLLCSHRPLSLPAGHDSYPDPPFGEPDAHGIVGESPEIWSLRQQLVLTGPRSGHVLITGESGTGKELAARAIHASSPRGTKPLVARNAATFPESLIDAELFGCAADYPNRGMPERPGIIGRAHTSTLFLDEIAELPHALQAHLLRALDAGEFQRLGESLPRMSDFRLLAATNRPDGLRPELRGRFSFHLELPSLNVRREDIPLLARSLLKRMAESDQHREYGRPRSLPGDPRGLSLEFCRQLVDHTYTLNVRELEALLWRSVLNTTDGVLRPVSSRDLRSLHATTGSVEGSLRAPERIGMSTLAASESDAELGQIHPARIREELDRHNGSLEATWRALGLKNRFALMRLIAKHDIGVTRRSQRRRTRKR